MRTLGRSPSQTGSIGAASDSLDQFSGESPADHEHQFAQTSRLLELRGTFIDFPQYPPCRIFAVGNGIFLHGLISCSSLESEITEIPGEFLPGANKLPLFLLTPMYGTSYSPIFIDTDHVLKTQSPDIWTFIDLSMLRYVKE